MEIDKVKRYSWALPSNAGVFKKIGKKELKIDNKYQRDQISKAKVMKIARNWDWRLFGALSVIKRLNNSFWIYDGGHRQRAALERSDIDKLPCMVFECNNIKEEAMAFVGSNSLKNGIGAYHGFRAAIVAEEPTALAAKAILDKYGYTATKNTSLEFGLSAIATFQRLVKNDHEKAEAVFNLCVEMANGSGEQFTNSVMIGLFSLVGKTNILSTRFRKILVIAGHPGLLASIKREKIIQGKGGEAVVAKAIKDFLNRGRGPNLKYYE